MKRIYKYPFTVTAKVTVSMVKGAKIIYVDIQDDTPCIWAEVEDESTTMVDYHFRIFGTGHDIPLSIGPHIATFQQPPFVWHLYHRRKW